MCFKFTSLSQLIPPEDHIHLWDSMKSIKYSKDLALFTNKIINSRDYKENIKNKEVSGGVNPPGELPSGIGTRKDKDQRRRGVQHPWFTGDYNLKLGSLLEPRRECESSQLVKGETKRLCHPLPGTTVMAQEEHTLSL